MSVDNVRRGFLTRQFDEGLALAAQSDLFELEPLPSPGGFPDKYYARFHCRGLVRADDATIAECNSFLFGIWFGQDHLRMPDPRLVTALEPANIFHPNIRGPFCCVGHVQPGIGLVDLIYQIFEILVYRNWAPHDGLNVDACQWARNHSDRFPIDPRPLKRRPGQGKAVPSPGVKAS